VVVVTGKPNVWRPLFRGGADAAADAMVLEWLEDVNEGAVAKCNAIVGDDRRSDSKGR
jgi:hypothetical protein